MARGWARSPWCRRSSSCTRAGTCISTNTRCRGSSRTARPSCPNIGAQSPSSPAANWTPASMRRGWTNEGRWRRVGDTRALHWSWNMLCKMGDNSFSI